MRFCLSCGKPLSPTAPEHAPRSYTPRHLAENILTSRTVLEGERKQVTVLFADVKGSMEVAEQVDPRKPVEASATLPRACRDGTGPHASRLHDDEPSREAAPAPIDEADNLGRECTARRSRVPEEQHACRSPTARIDELTEVFVLGEEDAVRAACQVDNRRIVGSGHDLRDGENVVASRSERAHHRSVAALVGHEPHSSTAGAFPERLDGEGFLVGYRVCSEGDRRTDVGAGEPWVGIEQIAFRRTFAQLAKDQLDGDACAADHRLAHHDLRVDLDAVAGGHARRFRHRHGIDVKLIAERRLAGVGEPFEVTLCDLKRPPWVFEIYPPNRTTTTSRLVCRRIIDRQRRCCEAIPP
jgi:class 3 adenylate cyclase